MVRKHDPVTDEVFECGAETGHCWCFDLPKVAVIEKGGDCKGPEHLAMLAKAQPPKDEES